MNDNIVDIIRFFMTPSLLNDELRWDIREKVGFTLKPLETFAVLDTVRDNLAAGYIVGAYAAASDPDTTFHLYIDDEYKYDTSFNTLLMSGATQANPLLHFLCRYDDDEKYYSLMWTPPFPGIPWKEKLTLYIRAPPREVYVYAVTTAFLTYKDKKFFENLRRMVDDLKSKVYSYRR